MRFLGFGVAVTLVVLLLALIPTAFAGPVRGVVTTCSSNWSCNFEFNTSAGVGWANGTSGGYLTAGSMTLKLPGEAKTSTGLTYWTNVPKVSTQWPNTTYWTTGNFIGTDVNTGKVVYGTTSSNYTATCHPVFRWCHDTYRTDNGTVVVKFTQAEATASSISCSPTSVSVSNKTSCNATVTNTWNSTNYPTGKVHFVSPGGGSFSNKGGCTLSSKGTCAFSWHPADDTCGSSTLSMTYWGATYYYRSSASTLIGVTGGC
ncbi:MAG: hypothetical protein L3K11_03565 [Thermoplasmata archaeon]|nr:hypothetical protein [Thermoplasmata archaeon]